VLEAIRHLGIAFHQTVLNLPGELASINKRLASITEGAVVVVKDLRHVLLKLVLLGILGTGTRSLIRKTSARVRILHSLVRCFLLQD
jgi:hypothetical protein